MTPTAQIAAIRQPTLVDAARQIAGALTQAPRSGDAEDVPEGVRYITISHTLAVEMAQALHAAIEANRSIECPAPVGCPCVMGTRHEWMFLHTQRESALRALVAQWRAAAADDLNDYAIGYDCCADHLERLLESEP